MQGPMLAAASGPGSVENQRCNPGMSGAKGVKSAPASSFARHSSLNFPKA
jgi:hypothetical protein